MENHHAINGKIHYKWPFSIAFYRRPRLLSLRRPGRPGKRRRNRERCGRRSTLEREILLEICGNDAFPYGTYMVLIWYSYGTYMVLIWYLYGTYMVLIWYLFHTIWKLFTYTWIFHMLLISAVQKHSNRTAVRAEKRPFLKIFMPL